MHIAIYIDAPSQLIFNITRIFWLLLLITKHHAADFILLLLRLNQQFICRLLICFQNIACVVLFIIQILIQAFFTNYILMMIFTLVIHKVTSYELGARVDVTICMLCFDVKTIIEVLKVRFLRLHNFGYTTLELLTLDIFLFRQVSIFSGIVRVHLALFLLDVWLQIGLSLGEESLQLLIQSIE